ncbi:MAG TPA: YibE/F family protein, partial [Jiangellaceae bacterium]|nr:YibE/F family protein [Jiangellaceae bacterium]
VALLGTLLSLTLTGVLGLVFTTAGRFTGLADEASVYLGAVGASIDIRGLLLAGLVIGALGVLDDVTVTQTAAVWELADADPEASRRALFAAGLRIGRQHVSATVNTLVLAYAGASLPVLLLFAVSGQGPLDTVTNELIAQEVVRALVGGLGIVAAVPLTTLIAALAVRERPGLRRIRGRRMRAAAHLSP